MALGKKMEKRRQRKHTLTRIEKDMRQQNKTNTLFIRIRVRLRRKVESFNSIHSFIRCSITFSVCLHAEDLRAATILETTISSRTARRNPDVDSTLPIPSLRTKFVV